jgi:molybdopterin-binding protein
VRPRRTSGSISAAAPSSRPSITNEAVDELGLAAGGDAYAVIKASDVMIAVD